MAVTQERPKVDKMLAPHWFELATRSGRWHFDYFLAQMRKPSEAVYTQACFGRGAD